MYESGDPDDNLRALVRKQQEAVVKAKARLREFEQQMGAYGYTFGKPIPRTAKETRHTDVKAVLRQQQDALVRAQARLEAIKKIAAEAGLFRSLN